MMFYEAPHKLQNTLEDMLNFFGNRKIALVKELTKIYENVERTTLSEASEKYKTVNPKGEFVLIVEGKPEEGKEEITTDDAKNEALKLVESGMSKNEAAKVIAKKTGLKKSDIYKALQE